MNRLNTSAEAETSDILIIGMGNVLMQDEGVGVRAVEELESLYHIPEEVVLMDGGTTGTELLAPMRGKTHLIVADAVNTGDAPGTLVRLVDEQVPAFFQTKLSNHQLGLSDLLALLKISGDGPRHVTIIGMVPHFLENKLGLSPEADEGLPHMVDMLASELGRLGFDLQKRDEPLTTYWADQARLERAGECV